MGVIKRCMVYLIMFLLLPAQGYANPFQTCIFPNDYSGAEQGDVIVSGADTECAEKCEDDCTEAFSYSTQYGESAADIVQECIASCKNGVSFTKKPYVANTDFPLWKVGKKEKTVTSSCGVFPQTGAGFVMMKTDKGAYVIEYDTTATTGNGVESFYYVVNTGMSITSDEVVITLTGAQYRDGFMCGTESSYLWPMLGSQGISNSPGRSSAIGLQPSAPWDNTISYNVNLTYWSVRNMNFTSFPTTSKISVQNGDHLSITYSGLFCQSGNCSMDIDPPTTLPPINSTATYGYDRGLIMLLPDGTEYNFPGNSIVLPKCTTDASGNITCASSSCTNPTFDDNGNASCQIAGAIDASDSTFGLAGSYYVSEVEIGNSGKTPTNIISFSGVVRNFSDDGADLSFKYNDSFLDASTTSQSSRGCYTTRYRYKSKCTKGFPVKRVDCCCESDVDYCGKYGVNSVGLGRTTITNDSSENQFADNVGGVILKVDWKGCYFNESKPEIEYALMPFGSMNNLNVNDYRGLSWKDAEIDNAFKINGSGILMFRLKPKGATLPGEVGGGYSISVKRKANSSKSFGLNAVVQVVNKQLFGASMSSSKISDTIDNIIASNQSGTYTNIDTQTPGIVQNIFTYLTQEPAFITSIRAALLMYIAYMGLSFMIGLSPINQKEAITILLKLGIMTTLISGASWDFFNRYLFTAVIKGSSDLMSAMIMNYDEYKIMATGSNAVNLFSFLDPILLQLFSNTIWMKMLALFFAGISAWVPAILLFLSIVLFVIFLFRVVMLYITSMIALSILTIVAPIFISFMLFQYTHSMFVGWLKQYISFAVQPVFVVTLASIMAKLIVFLLNSNLYFTVCKTCLIGWSVAKKNFCLIPSYMALPGLFGVEVGSINSPILSLESLMVLYLIVSAADVLCSHLSALASEIVTGSMMSMNLANASPSVANPLSLYNGLRGMIGMSDSAIAGRNALASGASGVMSLFGGRPPVTPPSSPNTPPSPNTNPSINNASLTNTGTTINPQSWTNPNTPIGHRLWGNTNPPTNITSWINTNTPTNTPSSINTGSTDQGGITVPRGNEINPIAGGNNIEGLGGRNIEGLNGDISILDDITLEALNEENNSKKDETKDETKDDKK